MPIWSGRPQTLVRKGFVGDSDDPPQTLPFGFTNAGFEGRSVFRMPEHRRMARAARSNTSTTSTKQKHDGQRDKRASAAARSPHTEAGGKAEGRKRTEERAEETCKTKRAKRNAQNEAQKKAHAAVSCLRSVSRTCGSCRRASSSECATPRPPATDCRHDGATPPR